MMEQKRPIKVIGKGIPDERDVIWKNVCTIGETARECLVEMSRTKTKFYIVAIDLKTEKFHHIEMWRAQAKNVTKACGNDLSKLMMFLEFRFNKLQIKDFDLLL